MAKAVNILIPLILLGVEWVLRSGFGLETQDFIGPTLATVGLGLLLATLEGKRTSIIIRREFKEEITRRGYTLVNKSELNFIYTIILFIFFGLAAWTISLYLATKYHNYILIFLPFLPISVIPGAVSYMIGTLFQIIREFI